MANNIALFKQYVALLDETYKEASLTGILDGASELARQGANANELIIPMIDMDGLADYSRNGGYVAGDVTMTNETVKCNFDRGRKFTVDALDNQETAMLAFGSMAGEFIRNKVVPEIDAFRISKYASKTGIISTSAALSTAANVVAALRTGVNAMDEAEVPYDDRVLFITPTLLDLIADQDTTKSKEVLNRFSAIQRVPQTRMYTKIQQKNGTAEGQTAGGYAKHADGKNINFLIVHKAAAIQYQKHVAPRLFTPEQNQDSDGWVMTYRNVGVADVYQNKLAGVYCHYSTT